MLSLVFFLLLSVSLSWGAGCPYTIISPEITKFFNATVALMKLDGIRASPPHAPTIITSLAGNVLPYQQYHKDNAIAFHLVAPVGLQADLTTGLSNVVGRSVLLTNFEQRGDMNEAKRVVQACLTRDKLEYYEGHIERFLSQFVARIKHGSPVLSTFRSGLVYFCLDILYGQADHPAYLRQLYLDMMDIQASLRRPLPGQSDEHRLKKILTNVANRPCLTTYIIQRFKDCVANNQQDTIAFWANKLGMDAQEYVTNSLILVLAWSHFPEVVRLWITPQVAKFDWMQKFREQTDGFARLNVIRESLRMEVPNDSMASTSNEVDERTGLPALTVHIPSYIARSADPKFEEFDLSRYDQHKASFDPSEDDRNNMPFGNTVHDFSVDPRDNETSLPKNNENLIPVFHKPIYTPFGLGYRRCAGEVFAQFLLNKMMDRLAGLKYQVRQGNFSTIGIMVDKQAVDNIFVTNFKK